MKKWFNENKWVIFLFLIAFIILYFPIPYYIEAPGGLIDTSNRVDIQDKYVPRGTFQMAYVSSIKANIPLFLFACIHPDWDLQKKEDVVADGESEKEAEYRNQMSLQEGNQNAIIHGYQEAKKYLQIDNQEIYVTYLFQEANTNLKVGDRIYKVMDKKVSSLLDFSNIIKKYPSGTRINIEVINHEKKEKRYAYIIEKDGMKIIGILTSSLYQIHTKPPIKIKMDQNESGGSGGLIMTLTIYNYLTKEDLTKGDMIAGTGTIEKDGTIGEIAGVKYKLMGAVKKKANIFLVPAGKNYQEAIKVKKEKNLKIDIISVKNIKEAIEKLKNRE